MNPRDLKDLQNASVEIYSTFFSNTVEFRALLPNQETNIYNEKKKANLKYAEPITLTALVDLSPPREEIRADLGSTTKEVATFEVPTLQLQESGIIDMTVQEIKRGIITFDNTDYNILGFNPITNVDEIFLFYRFETSGNNE